VNRSDATQGVEDTVTLFRPVGEAELALIEASGYHAFPPRREFQPFFYPILTEAYATEIARDWYTKDSGAGSKGFLTRCRVHALYAVQFPVQTHEATQHQELWVHANELADFNAHIVGSIEVVASFGPGGVRLS